MFGIPNALPTGPDISLKKSSPLKVFRLNAQNKKMQETVLTNESKAFVNTAV